MFRILFRRLNEISIIKRMHYIICGTGVLALIEVYGLWVSLTAVAAFALGAIGLMFGAASIIIAISVRDSVKEGISSIVTGAGRIKRGDLKTRVAGDSKNEMSILSWTFNELVGKLETNITEVDRLSVMLSKEQEQTRHYRKVKEYFLVNMSHEIRTPMNAILGFARYLQESLTEPDQLESIKMIIKSGDHLLVTLNDILDFANIETGEISFVCLPFNLRDSVQSICMLMESKARAKEIGLSYTLDKNIPDAVYGDSIRLNQIILSLTSNAIKFTERGGVSISARVISDQEDQVMIEFNVQDSGIGIPLSKQKEIFNPFEQGTNHMKRKFGGTGIGLSIVKHLVALMGSEINVKSTPDEGSEFYFRMSFFKANVAEKWETSAADSTNLISESEDGKGIKVLIVEDNTINQLLAIKLLQKKGYQIMVAENGKIALHKYNQLDFDIILMDLQMPEMDGYETTIHIRNLDSYKKNVPIVAMTAHTIKGESEKCLKIGMNAYISKPFQAAELYEKIRLLVKESKKVVPV
jgi:signal transduction histidine kinase/CheY-like chemotaxis protein